MNVVNEVGQPAPRRKHQIGALLPALRASGTFAPATLFHVGWCAAVFCLQLASYAVLLGGANGWLRAGCVLLSGMLLMQAGLISHEAGHGAMTRNARLQKLICVAGDAVSNGYASSFGLWRHRLHHKHPNQDGVDPDVDSPYFALHDRAAREAKGFARVLVSLQPWSLLCGLPFWVFGIRIEGAWYAIRHLRRGAGLDAIALVVHAVGWLVIPIAVLGPVPAIVNYVAITIIGGLWMGGILVLPHVGLDIQPRSSNEYSFMERQIRFSRNYAGSWLATIVCGGLNLQIEHHLLPHVPYIRLRRAQRIIAGYCREHGIPYHQMGYREAWREVLSHLGRMARLARATGVDAVQLVDSARVIRSRMRSMMNR